MRVQRGVETFLAADVTRNVTLSAVNLSKAFVLVSDRLNSGNNDLDEFWATQGVLTTTTNLALTHGEANATAPIVAWQVIEFLDQTTTVQSNTATIAANTTAITAPIVDNPGSEFLVFSRALAAAEVERLAVVGRPLS